MSNLFFLEGVTVRTLNPQGQIQVKIIEPMHWFRRRQHLDVAHLLRCLLGVLDGDILVSLEQCWRVFSLRSRDRLGAISR